MNKSTPTRIQIAPRRLFGWRFRARYLVGGSVVSWALILTLAVDVRAQGPAPAGDEPWSFSLGANGLSETVASPPGTAASSDALGGQFTVALANHRVLPRGGVTFDGTASQFLYSRSTGQSTNTANHFTYGVGVGASYAVSSRLVWNVADTVSSAYARDVTALGDAGLLPPKVLTRFNTASGGLSYEVSRRTRIRWGLSQQNVSIDSSQFANTWTVGTALSISRQISKYQTLGLVADYSRTVAAGAVQTLEGLSGTWGRPLGSLFGVSATGGVRAHTQPGQRGFQIDPVGSLGINFNVNKHFLPNDTFGLHVDRTISHDLGLGALLLQGFGANYGFDFTRLGFGATGSYAPGTDPADPNHSLNGRTGNTYVRFRLVRDVAIALNYAVYVRPPSATSRSASASLTYGRSWR